MAQTLGTATVTAHFSGTDFDRLRKNAKTVLKSVRLLGQDLARLDEHYQLGIVESEVGTALNG